MIELNKIYNEDNLATLARMEDNSIDLVVTSPPYNKSYYNTGADKSVWKGRNEARRIRGMAAQDIERVSSSAETIGQHFLQSQGHPTQAADDTSEMGVRFSTETDYHLGQEVELYD